MTLWFSIEWHSHMHNQCHCSNGIHKLHMMQFIYKEMRKKSIDLKDTVSNTKEKVFTYNYFQTHQHRINTEVSTAYLYMWRRNKQPALAFAAFSLLIWNHSMSDPLCRVLQSRLALPSTLQTQEHLKSWFPAPQREQVSFVNWGARSKQ